jgi:hypothetical protein
VIGANNAPPFVLSTKAVSKDRDTAKPGFAMRRAISFDTSAAQPTQDERTVLVIGADTNSLCRLALTKEVQHSEPRGMKTAAFCDVQHVGLFYADAQATSWHWP